MAKSKGIGTYIDDFTEFKCFVYFDSVVDEYAQKCANELKTISKAKLKKHRRNNTYAEGWEVKEMKGKNKSTKGRKGNMEYEVVVWNRTNYQLTHLLENGHLIVNKRGGVGWASAHPHIDEAYRRVKEPFIRAMEKAKLDFEIK